MTVNGSANRAMPVAPVAAAALIATISPCALIRRGIARPATIAPAPWQADSTPRNALSRPRPSVTAANGMTSAMPMPQEAITIAGNGPRSAGSSRRWRMPAASSARRSRPPRTAMSGTRRPARHAADARNVAASSIATMAPPPARYSAAPATGATMRMPERADSSRPFATGSSSSATSPATRPPRAALPTCCTKP